MKTIPPEFTPEIAATICERSAAGEGVIQVCVELGLDPNLATEWLRDHHMGAVVAAKKTQVIAKQEAEREAKLADEAPK